MGTVRRPTAVLLATAVTFGLVAAGPTAVAQPTADPAPQPSRGSLQIAELQQEAAVTGSVSVLVAVGGDGDPELALADDLAGTASSVGRAVDGLVAVQADPAGLDRLAASDEVTGIGHHDVLRITTTPSGPPTRAQDAHASGLSGVGRNVAVIDTGVDTAHPAFAGAVVAEACFVTGTGSACPNGETTQIGAGAGVPCPDPGDACGHGTHVAGIAVGRPSASQPAGVAPGSGLISIRIFGSDRTTPGQVAAQTIDLIAALDHIGELARTMPVDAVNLSLSGAPRYAGACDAPPGGDPGMAAVTQRIDRLRAAGVAIVAATGNTSDPGQVSYPSCFTGVVPVAATRADDTLAPFSNRNPQVRLTAPGVGIVSAAAGGGTERRDGTSMAAPQVSGAIALLRQRYTAADVSWLVARLESTGRPVTDPTTGLPLRRIDVPAALGLSPDPTGAGVTAAGAWVVTDRGRVIPLGQARDHGGSPSLPPGDRVVAGSGTRSGLGYWLTTARGQVVPFGDAHSFGDVRHLPLNRPITAMAPTRSGRGYWLLGGDGGVFSFGDAGFHGSTGAMALNAPVTDLAATPASGGYWLTAEDGGVFSFGDARFHGSTGGMRLNAPVVSISAGPRSGYWLVAVDGGVFAFDVPFLGSLPGSGVGGEGRRVRASALGAGYHILTADGWGRPFGRAEAFPRAVLAPGERAIDLIVLP